MSEPTVSLRELRERPATREEQDALVELVEADIALRGRQDDESLTRAEFKVLRERLDAALARFEASS